VNKNAITQQQREDLSRRFRSHVTHDEPEEEFSHRCMLLALTILEWSSVSREQSLALTHLEEVLFWVNAANERNSREGINE
jgi:hypothetical protein